MATKKGNGHDPGTAAIVEVLERIEKRIERVEGAVFDVKSELVAFKDQMGRELREINHRIEDTNEEVHALREEMREARELRERVTKLEAVAERFVKLEAVLKPTGT